MFEKSKINLFANLFYYELKNYYLFLNNLKKLILARVKNDKNKLTNQFNKTIQFI